MPTKKTHLTWVGTTAQERSFDEEIALARPITSEWSERPPTVDGGETEWQIVVEPLPGWLRPFWGSDGSSLYLRRPEGIWKTNLPQNLLGLGIVRLAIRSQATGQASGDMLLEYPDRPTLGWRDHEDEAVSLATMDDRRSPDHCLGGGRADFMGSNLRIAWNESGLVADVGDDACEPPSKFEFDGDWLFATDKTNGQVVGYPLDDAIGPTIRQALAEGKLWFRYRSPFIDKFDVRVKITQTDF